MLRWPATPPRRVRSPSAVGARQGLAAAERAISPGLAGPIPCAPSAVLAAAFPHASADEPGLDGPTQRVCDSLAAGGLSSASPLLVPPRPIRACAQECNSRRPTA